MRLVPLLAILAVPALGAVPDDAARVRAVYSESWAPRLVPLLTEVLRFPTVAGNDAARLDQQAWLLHLGAELGFTVRDAGPVTEIELPGPEGAPVLGLVVHGDVQPVEEKKWTVPPFAGVVKDGWIFGRGAADDKGPLIQALLAMKALKESGVVRTHTIRLLVGSDEESGSSDMKSYLKDHRPPESSLVLDSNFPVVVGEKAWNALAVTTDLRERSDSRSFPYTVSSLSAGLAPSIVPDQARITLRWRTGTAAWSALMKRLAKRKTPEGTKHRFEERGDELVITVSGRSAHGGVNLEGGRNALVALARLLAGELPRGGADDLLGFCRMAGQDLYGTGLGLTGTDPLWGRYSVNVATIEDAALSPFGPGPGANGEGKETLVIVTRRTPPLTGSELKSRLERVVMDFNSRTGARLVSSGFWDDEPLVFHPEAKIVKRLLADYARATGHSERPAISGGGTYAKRLPNSIAFGMWFPDKPYPGHDVDERVPIADLHKGVAVLIEALVDLACGPPLHEPFKP